MKKLLSTLFAFSSLTSFGQDYIEYQNIFNRIDKDVLANDLPLASLRLDSIEGAYSFIYAKHCFKALQISCEPEDYERANKWLKRCFLQGVPLWVVRNNEITSKAVQNTETSGTISQYDSLNSVYRSRINITISKTIDSLYAIDQLKTQKVNAGFLLFRHYDIRTSMVEKQQTTIYHNPWHH